MLKDPETIRRESKPFHATALLLQLYNMEDSLRKVNLQLILAPSPPYQIIIASENHSFNTSNQYFSMMGK